MPPPVLDPYLPSPARPWNAQRVMHLYNRLGYGATQAEIAAGLAMTPAQLVDQLIDSVVNAPAPEAPEYAYWTREDYDALPDPDIYFEHKYELAVRWVRESITNPIQQKITLFWHNHFVTQEEVYECNSSMWVYYDLLHRRAMGNFRTFVEDMGKNPAMLVYLNGNINIATEPNENYARELMELFTMGESNGYTQDDIVQVARALTGWYTAMYSCDTAVYFDNNNHDNGPKTIFGQTGPWGYTDVHNLIFTQRATQVSHHICEKIYRHFVYDRADEAVIADLAQTFRDSNWELAPVFRQLFKSDHFFDDQWMNTRIKDPIECMGGLYKRLGLRYEEDFGVDEMNYMTYMTSELGQEVYNPVDVAGWPGYHSWLNENTLTFRWSFSANFIYGVFTQNESIRDKVTLLARNLTSANESDERLVTAALVRFFLNRDLDAELFETAVQYFRSDIPENYFEQGIWNLQFAEVPYQVFNLMYYLTRLPEYQLC